MGLNIPAIIDYGALRLDGSKDMTGRLAITTIPTGTGVSQGCAYINPASATTEHTLFGCAVGGSQKFKVNEDGDIEFAGHLEFTTGTNLLLARRGDSLYMQNQSYGEPTALEFFTTDGDGTDDITFEMWGYGLPYSTANRHRFGFRWENSDDSYYIWTDSAGTQTGSPKAIRLFAGTYTQANKGMFDIRPDGNIHIGLDNSKLKFGAGQDLEIYHNADDSFINHTNNSGGLKIQHDGTTRIETDNTGIGFFAATPVAKPTGVAVSAAGIHAALVSLGLIAA
jgi:hypothetical protein